MERRITLVLRTDLRHLSLLAACVRGICREHWADERTRGLVELALVEACSNVMRHGHPNDLEHAFEVDVFVFDDRVEFVITDEGPAFRFERRTLPDVAPDEFESFPEGGLGLPLIQAIMDVADCRRVRGRNVLRLVKRR